MRCYNELTKQKVNTAVALGFFDGVHRGHRSVLLPAAEQKRSGLIPVCLTFDRSPKSVISGIETPLLMTREDKIKTLGSIGIEETYFVDFKSVMNLSAEEFFNDIIVGALNAKKLYCGFNYRFGRRALGDTETLADLCERNGIELTVAPPCKIGSEVVCSTLIKQKIASGRVKEANLMLESLFGFSAPVERGNMLGRELGTPTVNQAVIDGLILPEFGVYASKVTLESGEVFCGVTNVGVKPTVGGEKPLWETWMPHYCGGELYGEAVDVRLLDYIRPERRFESLRELKKEILANSRVALTMFEEYEPKIAY